MHSNTEFDLQETSVCINSKQIKLYLEVADTIVNQLPLLSAIYFLNYIFWIKIW